MKEHVLLPLLLLVAHLTISFLFLHTFSREIKRNRVDYPIETQMNEDGIIPISTEEVIYGAPMIVTTYLILGVVGILVGFAWDMILAFTR